MASTFGGVLEDVNGSFARFLKTAPKVFKAEIKDAVTKTCVSLAQRMEHAAPVGPDAPHIRDAVSFVVRGSFGKVGFINATEQAGPDNTATMAEVALYNEYEPNKQPFMRNSAEAEARDFVLRVKAAIGRAERALGTSETLGSGSKVTFEGQGSGRTAAGTGEGQGIFKK